MEHLPGRHATTGGARPEPGTLGLTLLVVMALTGCGAAASTPNTTPTRPVEPEAAVVAPTVTGTVEPDDSGSALERPCDVGSDADDVCDALDSDCDGRIDEGCGYAGGALQFTLAWDEEADLDLYVSEPGGDQIYFNRGFRDSSGGGHMDQDGRGQCRAEQAHTRVENIYWPDVPTPGEYVAEIHYFSPCGQRGVVTATLTIALGGRVLGSFSYRIEPEQRLTALRVRVDGEQGLPTVSEAPTGPAAED